MQGHHSFLCVSVRLTRDSTLTIHEHRGGGAFAACDDVFGHTGVVARVCHPGLSDDEIMVSRDEEVGVTLWVENVFVPLPLHLKNTIIHVHWELAALSCWWSINDGNCALCGFPALLHKQERPIFDVLPSLYPIPFVLYVSFVAAAVAITPPGTHHIIGLSSSSCHPCFPLRGQPPWCSFPVNCSWHLPSHFPVNSPCAGKLWWGIPPPLIPTASDWLANPLIALLLKQLVLFGDRENAADEVKQLDPVWSSKRRHTPARDVKVGARVALSTVVRETEDTERWQSDKEWDRE